MKKIEIDSFSKEIWEQNYKLENENSIEETWERVANAVAEIEKDKDKWSKEFYNILKDFKFIPGGRILANAGRKGTNTTLLNCFVAGPKLPDIDSIEGIYDLNFVFSKTLAKEGGIGANFSFIRPEGTMIKKSAIRTPGALAFMELFDKTADIVVRGTSKKINDKTQIIEKKKVRKGAMMGVLDCYHPDVEEFIIAKTRPNYLSKFNISVGVIKGFMEAVKQNKEWNLEFPDTSFEKYEEEWDGDITKWKEKGYPTVIVKTVKARELWNKILLSTYQRNEPGVLFLDLANKLNPLSYCENVRSSNPCVVGDTSILTNKGWIKIKDLTELYETNKYSDIKIITKNIKTNEIEESELKWCGITKENDDIVKVVFDNGEFLLVNKTHKFYNKNFDEIETQNLKVNDEIWGYNKLLKIVDIKYLNHKENVYDLTCEPNFNFFALYSNKETINNKKENSILCVDCGEILMSDYSACLLGSLNLTQFVKVDENKKPYFDFEDFKNTIPVAVRFLDNIIDITSYPLPEFENGLKNTRRIGLGIMGLGSTAYMLGLKYGNNPEFLEFVEKLMRIKQETEILTSAKLGKEKGNFPKFDRDKFFNTYYWKQHLNISPEIKKEIEEIGCMRNGSWSSNQPTGNTGIFANIVSGGIEPVFLKEYRRWVTVTPDEINLLKKKGLKIPDVFKNEWFETDIFKFAKRGDEEILKGTFENVDYEIDKSRGLVKGVDVIDYGIRWLKENSINHSEEVFVTTEQLTVDDHLEVLKVISKYISHNSSKTINLPNDYSFEDFKKVYEKAYEYGIKGVTTYRAGTMTAVLEKKEEIEIKQTELEKLFEKSNGNILTDNVKLPDEYYARGYVIRDKVNKKKYYVHIAFADSKYSKPFAIFINTNNKESTEIAGKTIEIMEKLANELGIKKELIEMQKEKYKGQSNIVKIARAIGFLLRHNAPIYKVVEVLDEENYPIGTLPFYLKMLLKQFIKDGQIVKDEICPECGENLIYMEGCKSCKNCGWSKCG